MDNYLLRVNLTNATIQTESISQEILDLYIGGKGLAAYYCHSEIPIHVDPLSPENKLMIFNGPLTGILGGFSRHVIATKSPQTNTFTDSYAGGQFGAELARTKYSGCIIEGKSNQPVILKIVGDSVSLESAKLLMGKSPYEVEALFPGYKVASIGIAGEKMVRFACVMNDLIGNQRAGVAGRGGIGAVMGSKGLKAIIVKGEKSAFERYPPDIKQKFLSFRRNYNSYLISEVVPGAGLGGNMASMQLTINAKITPVRNFQSGSDLGCERLTEAGIREVSVGKSTCYLCPIACGVRVKAKEGPYAGLELERIEYETVAMNGPNCGQMQIGTIIKAGQLCNEYGMDTISVGNIVGFVMDCVQRGLLDYPLEFGDSAGQIALIEMIGRREGIGDILAEGIKSASEKLGLQHYAVHVKGLEIPGYDARGPVGMALAYATADRGGDHLRAWTVALETSSAFSFLGKAKMVKEIQDRNAALWCLIGCDNIPANTTGDPATFVRYCLDGMRVLGREISLDKFLETGERINNLTRLFNNREGFTRREDKIPPRFFETKSDDDGIIQEEDFDAMLDEYYYIRGWDSDGVPYQETLERLHIFD